MKQLRLLAMITLSGLVPMLAQDATPDTTLTMTVNGSVSLISGSDCLGASGEAAVATAQISESATPTSSTANSATYTIPAGGVSATVAGVTFTSTSPWTMKITLGPSKDTMVIAGPGPLLTHIQVTGTLRTGSWTTAVLAHPATFAPSPQRLTSPSSKLQYTAPTCGTTVLGVTGAISNKAASAPLPIIQDESDQ